MLLADLEKVKDSNKKASQKRNHLEQQIHLTQMRVRSADNQNDVIETQVKHMQEGIDNMRQMTEKKKADIVQLRSRYKEAQKSAEATLQHWLNEIERKDDYTTIDRQTLDEAKERSVKKQEGQMTLAKLR